MNVQTLTPSQVLTQESHVLMIEEEDGVRCVLLESPTYSLGRDHKNTIVLPASKAVSRFHAMLLRIPAANHSGYSYRIVDGDATGKLSTNGVVVNGKRSNSHTLVEGDVIMLGNVQASYRLFPLSPASLDDVDVNGLDIRSTVPIEINPNTTHPEAQSPIHSPLTEDDLPPTMFYKKTLKTSISQDSE